MTGMDGQPNDPETRDFLIFVGKSSFMRPAKLLLTALSGLILFSCRSKEAADLLIYHSKIYTVDSAFSTAGALVVRD